MLYMSRSDIFKCQMTHSSWKYIIFSMSTYGNLNILRVIITLQNNHYATWAGNRKTWKRLNSICTPLTHSLPLGVYPLTRFSEKIQFLLKHHVVLIGSVTWSQRGSALWTRCHIVQCALQHWHTTSNIHRHENDVGLMHQQYTDVFT